jgi:hypothetical protein
MSACPLLDPEEGDSVFLSNIGEPVAGYITSHAKKDGIFN